MAARSACSRSSRRIEVDADVSARVAVSERTGTSRLGCTGAAQAGGRRARRAERHHLDADRRLAARAVLAGRTRGREQHVGEAEEENRKAVGLPSTGSVDELVKALNALAASPRISSRFLQALKAVGSLDADLEVL